MVYERIVVQGRKRITSAHGGFRFEELFSSVCNLEYSSKGFLEAGKVVEPSSAIRPSLNHDAL